MRRRGAEPRAIARRAWLGAAAIAVVTIATGCGGGAGSADVVRTGRVVAPDGLEIVFDDRGNVRSPEPALVFVHCWGCDRAYWREQLDAFADRYRVVSLDLGGHGESGKDRGDWSLDGLAGDVEAVIDHLGLERVILVGHSMGGPVALYAAQRMPDRVIGIVAVDTLHNAEQEFPAATVEMMAAGFEADFVAAMEGAVRGMAGEAADAELADWVVERACATDQGAAIGLMRAFAGFDMGAEMRAAGVPIRAINAAPASAFQPVTETELNRRYADYDAVVMDGVGHFLLLQQPEAFNALLADQLEAIEVIAAAP